MLEKKQKNSFLKEIEDKDKKYSDKKFLVYGTGAFGTAVAQFLIKKNEYVKMYGIDKKEVEDIKVNSKNSKYFSTRLSTKIVATTKIDEALDDVDVIVIATPSHVIRTVLEKNIVPNLKKPVYFVNLAKGIDYLKQELIYKVIEDTVPKKMNLGVLKLSGASFATELVKGVPTKFTLASSDIEISKEMSKYFETTYTKIIPSGSIKEIELVSVLKNPLAILMGIVTGLNYGKNTESLFFYESFEEMKRILRFYNMDENSVYSVAGIADLFLTGSSKKSRNFSTGYKIGKMNEVSKKILSTFTTIEGLRTIDIVTSVSVKNNLNLKLFEILYDITYNKIEPKEVLEKYFNN